MLAKTKFEYVMLLVGMLDVQLEKVNETDSTVTPWLSN